MKIYSVKRLVLALILIMGSFLTLPVYAWPDVDQMNMCGTAAKNVRAYAGDFRGWPAHDNYVSMRQSAYYFQTMCPETKASKMKKATGKKPVVKKRVYKKTKMTSVKRSSKYNKKSDCIRVDAMNTSGRVVRVVRRR